MAILRSVDGRFYEVPDDDLEEFEVPPEKVKEVLEELDSAEGPDMAGPGSAPGGGGQQIPQVIVQVSGGATVHQTGGMPAGGHGGQGGPGEQGDEAGVQPYGRRRRRWWWHNHWNNCWRNCWRNCY